MKYVLLRQSYFWFIALFLCASAGCDGDGTSPESADGEQESDTSDSRNDTNTDGTPSDSESGTDGRGDSEVEQDGGSSDGNHPRNPIVTECESELPDEPSQGVCSFENNGSANLLVSGTILTPGNVLVGGEILIDQSGKIACVSCDCGTDEAVSRLMCPHGVVSPGLINTHDHITFVNNRPYTLTEERYEHRHHWRKGSSGHTRLSYKGGASRQQILWGEIRMVMGGATSLNGSGSTPGFLRNLDREHQEGLAEQKVEYSTFPLGDGNGTLRTDGCDYPDIETTQDIENIRAYTPHVSEGIDAAARNEFLCMREGRTDLVQGQSAFIHGIGLSAVEIAEMAVDGTDLIWSPRTNITLYGDTARVSLYHGLGVRIALGTDWIVSGSMNMIRELQCADLFNDLYLAREDGFSYFTDEEIWLMATRNAAHVLGVGDILGSLEQGKLADIAIFDGRNNSHHRAVIDASSEDVVLVLRRGSEMSPQKLLPLYGDRAIVAKMDQGEECETIDVCGTEKSICVSRETNNQEALASLEKANSSAYPLFFCNSEPDNEPSCLPWREANSPFPNPAVDGSIPYSGESNPNDLDGDGLANDQDNCPSFFNPIRPLDDGLQADFDRDGIGDECDVCPLDASTTVCKLPSPDDLDNDGTLDTRDNCPRIQNDDQSDRDSDGKGDLCDFCPDDPNPGVSPCPTTIYEIKDPAGPFSIGQHVAIEGAIVTATASNGFFMQVDPLDSNYQGPENSGIFIYTHDAPSVSVGDRVNVTDSTIHEYNCQLQLEWAEITITDSGLDLPAPVETTTDEISTGGAQADRLEGVLIRVNHVSVADDAPAGCLYDEAENEFEVLSSDGSTPVRVDDFLYAIEPPPTSGEELSFIIGILGIHHCCAKLLPREGNDVGFLSAELKSFEPALSYVWEGTRTTTFPEPLIVSLSRTMGEDTTLVFEVSDPGIVVDKVIIPAGSLFAAVPVQGIVAATTPYTVSAHLRGETLHAEVRVVSDSEIPVLALLQPASATVPVDDSLKMTVVLDKPAKVGGIVVGLSIDGTGSIPETVTVLENQLSATFSYSSPSQETTDTITASLNGTELRSHIEVIAGLLPALVINEVDYDTVGTDNGEFIEIYNASASAISLDSLAIITFNGANNQEARRFKLTGSLGAGEFFVLAGSKVVVPSGIRSIPIPNNSVQNGAPDGIAIFDVAAEAIVDALCYEGDTMTAISIDNVNGTFNLVEGTATTATDSNSAIGSLIRSPDGNDSDSAVNDWFATTTPTPGKSNILSE